MEQGVQIYQKIKEILLNNLIVWTKVSFKILCSKGFKNVMYSTKFNFYRFYQSILKPSDKNINNEKIKNN